MPEEELQQAVLLRRQVQLGPGPPRLLASRVQPQIALGQDRRPPPAVPAGQGPEPRGQLQQAERLDQVVIRPRVQPSDPVGDTIPGRQHQHRGPGPRFAQPPAELEPIHARQHHVEDDRPVFVLRGQPQALRSVGRDVDRVAFLLQGAPEQPGHPDLVFHHEHPHAATLCRAIRRKAEQSR